MKLINLTCSKCGAQLKINQQLTKCMCQYCGNEMLINDEVIHHKIDNAFDAGYKAEMGRLKAQEDYIRKQNEIAEAERTKIENHNKELANHQAMLFQQCKIAEIISLGCAFIIGLIYSSVGLRWALLIICILPFLIDILTEIKEYSLISLSILLVVPIISFPYMIFKTKNKLCGICYGASLGYILGNIIRYILIN